MISNIKGVILDIFTFGNIYILAFRSYADHNVYMDQIICIHSTIFIAIFLIQIIKNKDKLDLKNRRKIF